MDMMPREQFVEKVKDVVKAKFPLVKLAPGDDGFTLRVNGHLVALEHLYRMTSFKPEEMDYHVSRWMVELLRAGEGSPDEEGSFELLKGRILPMVLSSETNAPRGAVVSQPLVDGLIVAYAVDSDRTIAYLTQKHFKQWKMSVDDLHETALANLVAKSESLSAHAAQDEETGDVNLIIFQEMDGYDASRLLLPSLHDRLREHLGSPFLAGIPNRDILLCFRDEAATVGRLGPQIKEDYAHMPHQVTDKLFLVTSDGIAPRTDGE